MYIADDLVRVFLDDVIADGVDQVGLAEAGAAVDEQRVVGTAGIAANLECGGTRQIIRLADDEVVEGEIREQPGLFIN